MPFAAIAMSITAAAKIELFTYLVCQAIQPTVSPDQGEGVVSLVARHLVGAYSGEVFCYGVAACRRCLNVPL